MGWGFSNGNIPKRGYANNFMLKGSGIRFWYGRYYDKGSFYSNGSYGYNSDFSFIMPMKILNDKEKH